MEKHLVPSNKQAMASEQRQRVQRTRFALRLKREGGYPLTSAVRAEDISVSSCGDPQGGDASE